MKKNRIIYAGIILLLCSILAGMGGYLFKKNNENKFRPILKVERGEQQKSNQGLITPIITSISKPVPEEREIPEEKDIPGEAGVPGETDMSAEASMTDLTVQDDALDRSYASHRDFPYDTMKFVDDETYVFLKEAYAAIDFYGEFKTGDLKLYDEYIEKYRGLVDNEVTFYDAEEDKNYYLSKYKLTGYTADYDPKQYDYYLFDMDGDNTPELCIRNNGPHAIYVYQYKSVSGEITLWREFPSHNEMLHGTRKVQWDWDGMRYGIYELDENGEEIFDVYFLIEASHSNGNVTYMLTVPCYNGKPIDIPDEMKAQAYFSEENGMYHFMVTEAQFDEITMDYFAAYDQSKKEIKNYSYTYDELFGTGPSKKD